MLEKVHSTLRRYASGFDRFRTLYIPDDFSTVQKLNKEEKKESEQILANMEVEVWRIKKYVAALALPIKALSDHKMRGTFYKEMSENQKKELSELISEIQDEHKHIQWR
ncbi:MAG: hypothetical protein IJ727_05250, partial [Treponema sp.]|nr:hypothetical protein [Treponema sp.]